MATEIRKNEAYSQLMMGEGSTSVVDEDGTYTMELPEWADEKKIKMGQRFFMLNANAMLRSLVIGLVAVASIPSIIKVLMFTKQSSTPALAYRRFKANSLHASFWYRYEIKEGTIAWTSLEAVRKMHIVINKRTTKAGTGMISQADTAITQFLFMGFQVLMPDKFGIVGTREQFEAFSHLWRVIGFMLGLEDRFNCCGDTLEETSSRLQVIVDDFFRPGLMFPWSDFDSYTRTAVDGMSASDPTLHYDSLMFAMKRAVKVPGYCLFQSEVADDDLDNTRIWRELSYYTRLRVLIDVVVFEYLSHVFVFRWIFNIVRIFFGLLDKVYPILAVQRFGKKYAFVEIMKSKN